MLDVGVGEASNLARLLPKLVINHHIQVFGFDVAYSRVMYANSNTKAFANVDLFLGDLFSIPMLENSIDIVYTVHALEPNGGRESEALQELYRVTRKYLILFEPEYELGSESARNYIDKHGYVKGLYSKAKSLGYNVTRYELLVEHKENTRNNMGVILIEKDSDRTKILKSPLACPVTKTPIKKIMGNYFSEDSLLLYPVVNGIPCLLPSNAIVATHYLDKIL